MSVRAKRGAWPDRDGNYRFVDGRGRHLLLVIDDRFGSDTEAVAERILAAINGDTVPAPTLPDDLPSWVSMHATATGADLIEHDPNGEVWVRWVLGEWRTDHAKMAIPGRIYLVRRRPVPVEPTTEKVSWGDAAIGRLTPRGHKITTYAGDGQRHWVWAEGAQIDADSEGMVTVLREDGAS